MGFLLLLLQNLVRPLRHLDPIHADNICIYHEAQDIGNIALESRHTIGLEDVIEMAFTSVKNACRDCQSMRFSNGLHSGTYLVSWANFSGLQA